MSATCAPHADAAEHAYGWLEPPVNEGAVAAERDRLLGRLMVEPGGPYVSESWFRSGHVRVWVEA